MVKILTAMSSMITAAIIIILSAAFQNSLEPRVSVLETKVALWEPYIVVQLTPTDEIWATELPVTVTAAPTITPTSEPFLTGIVRQNVNVRSCAGTSCPVKRKLLKGATVFLYIEVVQKDGFHWMQIQGKGEWIAVRSIGGVVFVEVK